MMRKILYLVLIVFCVLNATSQNYKVSKKIAVAGDDGWDYLAVDDVNQHLFVSHGNVVNVIDIRVYNQIGGQYSSSQVAQSYKDKTTKEILQSDMTIFMKSNQIYQIRFPNVDIMVRTKSLSTTTY